MTGNVDISQIIISRDISKFQQCTPMLKNKLGNRYLNVFIKSIDWDIPRESHEYILNTILKLNTNFKTKHIKQFISLACKDTLDNKAQVVYQLQISLLIKILKSIQFNDSIISNMLKCYQKQPQRIIKHLIHELLGVVNYFTLYKFLIQSDLSICWIEILSKNIITQEELDYYCVKLNDSRLLCKLKSSIIVVNKINSVDKLLEHSRIKSICYLLEHTVQILTVNLQSIPDLSRSRLANKVINKLLLSVNEINALEFYGIIHYSGVVKSKEWLLRKHNVEGKIVDCCSKYIHQDIAKHVLLEYFTGQGV